MFFEKLSRTFFVMLRGWLVCNLITFLIFAIWIIHHFSIQDSAASQSLLSGGLYLVLYTTMALVYSGIAVAVAWLAVLLPVDLCISESSWLRAPVPAAVCGAGGGFFSFMAFWASMRSVASDSGPDLPWLGAFGALAAITGLTAALNLANHGARVSSLAGQSARNRKADEDIRAPQL
jgi:hypothetical protein